MDTDKDTRQDQPENADANETEEKVDTAELSEDELDKAAGGQMTSKNPKSPFDNP